MSTGAGGGAAQEGAPPSRAEGWAVLGQDGRAYSGSRLAGALSACQCSGTLPEAVAFAVAGESGDTLLPGEDWRLGAEDADPHTPVAVKYLGRWVVVTLAEIPDA